MRPRLPYLDSLPPLSQKFDRQHKVAGLGVLADLMKIKKDGSSLEVVRKEGSPHEQLLRHSGLPEHSVAAWMTLHDVVPHLFDDEAAKILFGVWHGPQVAPLAQRGDGRRRAYFYEGQASAYSSFVGYDTVKIAARLGLTELAESWSKQNGGRKDNWQGPIEARWLTLTGFYLIQALYDSFPRILDSIGLEQRLLEYWQEFVKVNKNNIARQDLIELKELKARDISTNMRLSASLKMVQLSHELCQEVRSALDIFQREEYEEYQWEDHSVPALLLFLLHIFQTNAQQNLFWFLGMSHGHFHAGNTVSRTALEETQSLSPLETRIIDFDQLKPSFISLAQNNELYSHVDAEAVYEALTRQENPLVQLTVLHYLPLPDWDDQCFTLVKQNRDPLLTDSLIKLVAFRAGKDVADPKLFTRFADLVFDNDKEMRNDELTPFFPTLQLLADSSVEPLGWDLSLAYQAIHDGAQTVNAFDLSSDAAEVVLLSIFQHKIDAYYLGEVIEVSDFEFTLDLARRNDLAGESARRHLQDLFLYITPDWLEKVFSDTSVQAETRLRQAGWSSEDIQEIYDRMEGASV